MGGVVIVITRNGYGAAWKFSSLLDVRLHPITQAGDDVVATSGRLLLESYQRSEVAHLATLLPAGSTQRSQASDALKSWAEEDSRRRRDEAQRAADIVFDHLVRTAPRPPEDPATLIKTIVENRRATEGRVAHYRLSPEERQECEMAAKKKQEGVSLAGSAGKKVEEKRKAAAEKPAAPAAAKQRASRVPDGTIINFGVDKENKPYGKDNNPKRPSSASEGRFALYVDGMTVGEAKKAGVTASDIVYDEAHGYIKLTAAPAEEKKDPPAEENAEQPVAEEGEGAAAADEAGEPSEGEEKTED